MPLVDGVDDGFAELIAGEGMAGIVKRDGCWRRRRTNSVPSISGIDTSVIIASMVGCVSM